MQLSVGRRQKVMRTDYSQEIMQSKGTRIHEKSLARNENSTVSLRATDADRKRYTREKRE